MKQKMYWGLVGILILLLVACNSATPTGATSEEGGVGVTISVAFPDSSGQVLKQGVPSGINSVEVIVYRSGNRVGSAQLMPAKPSATLSLKPGFTYRFTSSAKNNGTEVAWGDISQDVGSNTKITLPLRTIGVSAGFGATTYNSATNTLNVPLVLTAPDGSPVPLADYGDPVYTVKGGKLVLDFGVPVSTKLGAVINPDSPSGSVEVSVNVKALGADHKEKKPPLHRDHNPCSVGLARAHHQRANRQLAQKCRVHRGETTSVRSGVKVADGSLEPTSARGRAHTPPETLRPLRRRSGPKPTRPRLRQGSVTKTTHPGLGAPSPTPEDSLSSHHLRSPEGTPAHFRALPTKVASLPSVPGCASSITRALPSTGARTRGSCAPSSASTLEL